MKGDGWLPPTSKVNWLTRPPAQTRTGRQTDSARLLGEALKRRQPGEMLRLWMTPTARYYKDGATSLANTLVTPPAGGSSCDTPRTLNPLFVEALMGWPPGWTDPEAPMRSGGGWTGFGSVATEWRRWLRRMRGELLNVDLSMLEADTE